MKKLGSRCQVFGSRYRVQGGRYQVRAYYRMHTSVPIALSFAIVIGLICSSGVGTAKTVKDTLLFELTQ